MADDFVENIIQSQFYGYGSNICFDCENCYGRCPWTAIDPETGKVKFEPVDGWKTQKRSRRNNGRQWEVVEQIIECPLFKPTPERKK